MSDPIFEPFEPTSEPPAAGEPEKRNRRQRGNGATPSAGKKKRKTDSRPQTAKPPAEAASPKPPRKRRTVPAKGSPAKGGLKLDIHTILPAVAGMKPEDAHLFSQMVSALQKSNKKARGRIVAALGKVFA